MKRRKPFAGNRLRVLRAEYRVSQREVAEALEDYSTAYVSLLENGRAVPSKTVLAKLSKFFGVPASEIFPQVAA